MDISINLTKYDKKYVDVIAEAGFDKIDLWLGDNIDYAPSERSVFEIADYIRYKGLDIGQVHLPYTYANAKLPGSGSFADYDRETLSFMKKRISLMQKLGCKIGVTHLISLDTPEETKAFNLQFIDSLRPAVRDAGVRIALETTYTYKAKNGVRVKDENGKYIVADSFVCSVEEMIAYADYGKEDGFGICLDTGHAQLLGYDPAKLVRGFGSRLIALHVNNNNGYPNGDDYHFLPGAMEWHEQTNWADFSAALTEIGYGGTYNFELALPDIPSNVALSAEDYRGFYIFAANIARHLAAMTG